MTSLPQRQDLFRLKLFQRLKHGTKNQCTNLGFEDLFCSERPFPTEKKQTASLWPGLFQTAPIISIIADLSLFNFRKLSACYPPKTVPKDLNIGETPRFGEFLGLRNLQPCHLVADSATSSFKTGTPWERHGELLPCAWRVMSVASRFWCNMAASTVVSCPFCWFVSLKSSSTP